jgi:hypothetical protein
MVAAHLLSGCVMGPCGIGFAAPDVSLRDRKEEQNVATRFYAATHADVLLPDVTPYDANAGERDAYLESYREGYRCGLLVGIPGQDLRNYHYPKEGGSYFAARVDGWNSGKKAASNAPTTVTKESPSQPSQPTPSGRG